MSTLILSPLDFGKNQALNLKLHNLSSDPSVTGTDEGLVWVNTTSHLVKWYNGSAIIDPLARANHSGTQLAATISDFNTAADARVAAAAANYDAAGAAATAQAFAIQRANHTGTQLASTISDFNTAVRTNRLDQMAAPTASVSMGSQLLTNLATPVSGTDAATKQYVDDAVYAISWKNEVRVATTAAGTLASSFSNGQVIDGITLATGDRILIKNQAAPAENGIYIVPASGAPTRAADADSGAELSGATVFVTSGSVGGGTTWNNNTTGTITPGSTALTWTQIGAGGGFTTAGAGLTNTGSTVQVGAGTGIVANTDDVAIDTTLVARKKTGLIGNGSLTALTYNHALGNQHVVTQVFDATTNKQVIVDVTNTDANNVTITFAVAPASNAYRVVVIG